VSGTPGPVRRWVLAARPRTLPAALVPVALGSLSVRPHALNFLNVVLCAWVALALQIATNFANDYSDGVKGTDEVRVGPFRLTASRVVPASTVRNAAMGTFAAAALGGVFLAARTSWWFVLIGAAAIAAGWLYTGGPRPYGYMGLGEVFVMIFFGFVATVGTAYAMGDSIPSKAWWLGLGAGSMACALLEANNIRDIDGDQLSGKKTLAARAGRSRASWLYVVCGLGATLGVGAACRFLGCVVVVVYGVAASRFLFTARTGRELLPLLAMSARLQLLVGLATGIMLAVAPGVRANSLSAVVTGALALAVVALLIQKSRQATRH